MSFEERARARKNWPVRVFKLGEERAVPEALVVLLLGVTNLACSAPYPNGGTVSIDREGDLTISMPITGHAPVEQSNPNATLAIEVTPTGYLLEARSIARAELVEAARRCAAEFGADCQASVAASPTTPHRLVVETIDLLRGEHVTHFAINLRPESLR